MSQTNRFISYKSEIWNVNELKYVKFYKDILRFRFYGSPEYQDSSSHAFARWDGLRSFLSDRRADGVQQNGVYAMDIMVAYSSASNDEIKENEIRNCQRVK